VHDLDKLGVLDTPRALMVIGAPRPREVEHVDTIRLSARRARGVCPGTVERDRFLLEAEATLSPSA